MVITPIRIPLPEIFNMKTVNSWLIKEPIPTLIDCGELTEESWTALNQHLKENGLTIKDIKKIVITHAHVDHMGMANRVVEASGAKVWLSNYAFEWGYNVNELWDKRSELIMNTFEEFVHKDSMLAQFFNNGKSPFGTMLNMWEPISREQLVQFNTEDGIDIGGQHWQVIYTPGHSSTQTVFFHQESRHIFSADMLLKLTPTAVIEMDPDDPKKRQRGLPKLIQSFHNMKTLNIEFAYPGHYEAFGDVNQIIDHQLARIEKRLLECKEMIKSGKSNYDLLLTSMYANRISFPAIVMLIGYIDELYDREQIKKEIDNNGVYRFEVIS